LDTGEQAFAGVLGADLPKYRDVIARYSLDLKGQGVISDQDFEVTDAMLAEFLTRLRARGVDMPDSVWVGARELVADQFGFEIARNVFGREAELLRRIKNDIQVDRAVQLLRDSPTQEHLLASVTGN
jgi:hypothetical protein